MLLVRLYADLSEQPLAFLRRIREASPMPALPAGSRLAATFSWLERQFGISNAVRALAETADDVLRAIPAASGPATTDRPGKNRVK